MLNLISAPQMREADAFTIRNKPISSLDLMEAAASAFAFEFRQLYPDINIPICIFCGTGNNGGDGLAIARLLRRDGYRDIRVLIVRLGEKESTDFLANLGRLKETDVPQAEFKEDQDVDFPKNGLIIDAILGSGLSRSADGLVASVIAKINRSENKIVSVDIPSGLPSEGIIDEPSAIITAELAISFQRPRINFYFPESGPYLSQFKVVNIGLDEDYTSSLRSGWSLVTNQDIRSIFRKRRRFGHKGTYGHALVIAGSRETMGAALLSAEAALYTGAGLTTACIPESGLIALNSRSPEVMALIREDLEPDAHFEKYSAIAFGPGTGTGTEAAALLKRLIQGSDRPLVIDADGLNIISQQPQLLRQLPGGSVLTPHLKEFDRIFGEHRTWWERVETARTQAKQLRLVIVLKNQYTFMAMPDGQVLINPTGNPAMAAGGMGDVLTGILASLLAQGYSPADAVVLGCYIHGEAGDELYAEGMNCVPPRHIIKKLPYIIKRFTQ